MAVIKTYELHYIDVPRALALRRDLNSRAKGVLLFLLAVPEDWGFGINELPEYLGETEEDISSILDELIEKGYIVPIQDDEGNTHHEIYSKPQLQLQDESGEEESQ